MDEKRSPGLGQRHPGDPGRDQPEKGHVIIQQTGAGARPEPGLGQSRHGLPVPGFSRVAKRIRNHAERTKPHPGKWSESEKHLSRV